MFGIERRTEKAKKYWRNKISHRKVKFKLGTYDKCNSGNSLGVQTTIDFYYGFWSPATRLKSPLGIKPLLHRGNQIC